MLRGIAQLPTAENSAIRLHSADNVAIARVPLTVGTEFRLDDLCAERLAHQEFVPWRIGPVL